MPTKYRSKLDLASIVDNMSTYLKRIADKVDTMPDEDLNTLEEALSKMTKAVYYKV